MSGLLDVEMMAAEYGSEQDGLWVSRSGHSVGRAPQHRNVYKKLNLMMLILAAWCVVAAGAEEKTDIPPDECKDDKDFVDATGFTCEDWRPESCQKGGQWYGLTEEQMEEVRTKCKRACGCGPPCRDNIWFLDNVTNKRCTYFEPGDCDKLEAYAYTGLEAELVRKNCRKSCGYCETRPQKHTPFHYFTDCRYWTPLMCYYAEILFPMTLKDIEKLRELCPEECDYSNYAYNGYDPDVDDNPDYHVQYGEGNSNSNAEKKTRRKLQEESEEALELDDAGREEDKAGDQGGSYAYDATVEGDEEDVGSRRNLEDAGGNDGDDSGLASTAESEADTGSDGGKGVSLTAPDGDVNKANEADEKDVASEASQAHQEEKIAGRPEIVCFPCLRRFYAKLKKLLSNVISDRTKRIYELSSLDPRLKKDPLYATIEYGYVDEREFLYLMNNFQVCEDAVTYRDAYGYSCAFWNERCSRYDPPIAEINRHVVYTFGQIKEVHLLCRRTCRFCLEDDML